MNAIVIRNPSNVPNKGAYST